MAKSTKSGKTIHIDLTRPHDPAKVVKLAQDHLAGKDVSGRINSGQLSEAAADKITADSKAGNWNRSSDTP